VSLVGLEPELLAERADELGPRAAWFEADVTDIDAIQRAIEETVERFGGIDVLIANAGIAPIGTVATIDPADFERTIEINLLGVWRTVRAALPYVTQRSGYILPIASLAAALHMPLMAHYAATKAGVEAFSNSLRGEVAHTGTTVGVAYFSFIDTDMVRESLDESPAKLLRESTPGPVSAVASVETAGRAIVRAIERRARKAYAPRWVPIPLALRGMLQPLLEKGNRDAIEQAVKMAEAEAAAKPARDKAAVS
jgi:NAD(P)-dependent dehydrogenase (short-subunit alcohol dehydrogenase family)